MLQKYCGGVVQSLLRNMAPLMGVVCAPAGIVGTSDNAISTPDSLLFNSPPFGAVNAPDSAVALLGVQLAPPIARLAPPTGQLPPQ